MFALQENDFRGPAENAMPRLRGILVCTMRFVCSARNCGARCNRNGSGENSLARDVALPLGVA